MRQGNVPTVIINRAGPGGLTLYHDLMKNKIKKEFNVKIFNVKLVLSRLKPSIAIINPIPNAEFHGITIADHLGNFMFKPPNKQVKEVYELSKITDEYCALIFYRDRLRNVLLEDVPVQWGELVLLNDPNDPEKYLFKTYNPFKRRNCEILTHCPLNLGKVVELHYLEKLAHAMSPVLGLGTNNAIEDAYVLSQALINYSSENYIFCIQEYEKEMLKRTSAYVLNSRSNALRISTPVGYFYLIIEIVILRL
ncbi:11415_t:CDS:2 [Funneliformis mosseae]|uniref:11415_t:CDS:1 n=1 Tax=Funneliformis mosseae TaxID=27381 RepID=A0A9N9CIH9_FUNMO|nr:11415_t:CDS:2 [Funneliformis mosseae]